MNDTFRNIFPNNLYIEIVNNLDKSNIAQSQVTEIRCRVNCSVIICCQDDVEINTNIKIKKSDIDEMLGRITKYSIYAFEDEIKQGYITIEGGHRVGLAGQIVAEDERILNMKNISFLNIRFAHQIIGCGMQLIPYIFHNGRLLDTLIISPPGCGKTTLLRDIVRIISDGNEFRQGLNVGLVDERSEIAGSYMGEPQLDVGEKTDIMDACPKAEGMLMLLRSMNPDVIAVDEIGKREDIEAINYVSNCGCGIIATAHGESVDDIRTRPIIRKLVEERVFNRYVVLSKNDGIGTIESVFDERGNDAFH